MGPIERMTSLIEQTLTFFLINKTRFRIRSCKLTHRTSKSISLRSRRLNISIIDKKGELKALVNSKCLTRHLRPCKKWVNHHIRSLCNRMWVVKVSFSLVISVKMTSRNMKRRWNQVSKTWRKTKKSMITSMMMTKKARMSSQVSSIKRRSLTKCEDWICKATRMRIRERRLTP